MTNRQSSTVRTEARFGPILHLPRRKMLTGENSTPMTTAQNNTSKKGRRSQPNNAVAAASRSRKARASKRRMSANIRYSLRMNPHIKHGLAAAQAQYTKPQKGKFCNGQVNPLA